MTELVFILDSSGSMSVTVKPPRAWTGMRQ